MAATTTPVALVTGGAVRVGRAISLGLAEAGFHVAVNYKTSEAAARDVQSRIHGLGRDAILVQGDVSEQGDVMRMAEAVNQRFDRLDLVVNNAASFASGHLPDLSLDEWNAALATNVSGPFLVLKAFAELLKATKGSVVNLVDLSAFKPWKTYPHHSVSKAALLQLTRVAAKTLAPHVRVNAVAPGHVLSPDDWSQDQIRESLNRIPLKRLGEPEDVVRTVLFLARSPFITGEVVVVDGGESLG